jgi:uncharacterized membrane protein YkoI
MSKTGAFISVLAGAACLFAVSADAGQFRLKQKYGRAMANDFHVSQLSDDNADQGNDFGKGDFAVSPSQAASIAKRSWPGSKVLRVQLLPSGVYAVTLKQGGEVSRVLVDANSGDLV